MNMTLRYAMTVLLSGLALLLGASAASAHGGPIKLEVVGDGAHNINVLVTYKEDNHPVTETVTATLLATSTDGRSFGPIPLRSSSEGQNLYHAAEPLPSGEWKVTVTATDPGKAHKTVKVTAQDPTAPAEQAAASPAPLNNAAPKAPALDNAAAAAAEPGDDSPLGTLLIIGALTLAAATAAILWLRRPRAHP
ncbi:hypothetical protein ABZT47_35235 [Sphaerisporangium sp. NPDC005289]|uniref:hypothetical protein n=1 Tax=Sphaerisporangium sp. NPDC005289 TaxID=3155247 RepID=UPI0033BA23FE